MSIWILFLLFINVIILMNDYLILEEIIQDNYEDNIEKVADFIHYIMRIILDLVLFHYLVN